jgi:hypothetical protein
MSFEQGGKNLSAGECTGFKIRQTCSGQPGPIYEPIDHLG